MSALKGFKCDVCFISRHDEKPSMCITVPGTHNRPPMDVCKECWNRLFMYIDVARHEGAVPEMKEEE